MKEVVAYAILDKKGKLSMDPGGPALIFKTRALAVDELMNEEEETVQKVRIVEA